MAEDKKSIIPAIRGSIPNIKFNLEAQEQFARERGVVFEHWMAIPSTIGSKDIGDYRRPDSLDTISENGFLYKKVGEFSGTIVGNSKKNQEIEGGIFDNSVGRLVIPKYYLCPENKEIALLPGDRIYAKGIELKVPNYQKVEFHPKKVDVLQFPVECVTWLKDSNNIEYEQGAHFKLDDEGNIKWIDGQKNPGIDPETGLGRTYGVRYMYKAFWYIQQIINEIRITNTEDPNTPARLPYHAVIQREYVYHNKVRGEAKDTKISNHTERTNEPPLENIHPEDEQFQVKVDIRDFE